MARRGAHDMTARTCDWWARGDYCGDTTVRRYMNGWRCIKHAPAVIRRLIATNTSTQPPERANP
jgi:hypothetical protein